MKRKVAIGLGLALIVASLVLWKTRGSDGDGSAGAQRGKAPLASQTARSTLARTRPDPATLSRGTISGTVRDEAGAPIAGARVCAGGSSHDLDEELLREPACSASDDGGRYVLAGLLPARYSVGASAKPYRPALHHPGGDRKRSEVRLAAGAHQQGIDIVLRPGGVELSGTVSDVTGGPVANARVMSSGGGWMGRGASFPVETDARGAFSLWVEPGDLTVMASADGYADATEWTRAPGTIEMLLTPESSLSGTVVDASTGAPVEGARVMVGTNDWGWEHGDTTFSDARGQFRVGRLSPGRHVTVARSERGYGRTEGSVLVGLGQHVDGVVVKLFPASRLEGTVMVASTQAPCARASVSLEDRGKQRRVDIRTEEGTGKVWAEGVLPGTYSVEVRCSGFQSRERYEPVTVADADVTGLVWEVDAGATIRGRVTTKRREAVESAYVSARSVGGDARGKDAWSGDTTQPDGSYTLDGLKPGTFKIDVVTDRGIAKPDDQVEVAAGATVTHDIVLDEAGAIRVSVVDDTGAPVAGVLVTADPLSSRGTWRWRGGNKTDETGTTLVDALRPGDYRVTAARGWREDLRKPGTTDDAKQGERVAVRASATATVKLVVESLSGTIRGTVVDAQGKAVSDAYVSAARESDAAGAQRSSVRQTRWYSDERPVIAGVDGTFEIGKLASGNYTIRAHRKGGGEAVAEHVAVGATTRLQIQSTGSLEGLVSRDGGPPDDLVIQLRDVKTGFSRREQFFKTDGRFAVRDLPAGNFQVTAEAEGGQKEIEVTLAEGEDKTGVAIQLDALVTLVGRLVEHGSGKPAPGIRMIASAAKGGGFRMSGNDDEREHITDGDGRFTVKSVPRGKLRILGFPKDWEDNEYSMLQTIRVVDGKGTFDLGELTIFRNRLAKDQVAGEHGLKFAEPPPGTEPEDRKLEVSYIEPGSPAATTEIKVGDVIVSVDGVDVRGVNGGNAWSLMTAPAGTKLVLGLARDASVTLVLAPRT